MTNNTPTIKDIYEAVENLRQEIRECYVTKEEGILDSLRNWLCPAKRVWAIIL